MFTRSWCSALLLACFLLSGSALGQEQVLLDGQAGRYPMRAYLGQSAAVGPARLVVELGQPKELFQLPPSRHTPAPGSEPSPPAPVKLAVSVVLDMPEMHMAKPLSIELAATAPNRFEADLLLTMKGAWRAQFVVTTPEGEFRPLARFEVGAQAVAKDAGDGGLELCDPDQSEGIELKIRTLPEQPRVGKNLLRIELPGDVTVPVMVGVDMPGSALGIPPSEALRREDGSYEALVALPLAGYWQVRIDLNGRALPPYALTVEPTATSGPSRALLPIALAAAFPLFVFVLVRRRDALKPATLGAALLLGTLAFGAAIEGAWPSQHSKDMEMDMLAFDMGLGHLSAPLPVLEAKLEETSFVTTRDYQATVFAGQQSPLVAPSSGILSDLVRVGTQVSQGTVVARVGSQPVRAPFRGVVVQTMLSNGASVQSGLSVLSLSDPLQVVARARVPLSDRDMLGVGMPVELVGQDGRRAKGTLRQVSAISDGRGFEIEATLDNRRPRGSAHGSALDSASAREDLGSFAIGENGRLKVAVEGPRSTIMVPREAVRETADREPEVFLVTQVAGHRVARAQKVTLGVRDDSHVQVLNGLQEGQIIVARLEPSLRDGDVVTRATLGEGVFRSLVVPGDGSH